MGRRPKEKKGYFCENEENAIISYINETDIEEKNKIFNNILYPALTKMVESLIRRYKLFIPDEEFEKNFNDTISYLLTKINHFKQERYLYELYTGSTENIDFVEFNESEYNDIHKCVDESDPEYICVNVEDDTDYFNVKIVPHYYKKELHKYKAYSYCGTICKNYLMYKSSQYTKLKNKNISYDNICDDINNDERYATNDDSFASHAEVLIKKISNSIEKMIDEREFNGITDEEVKVGKSLINLFRNWEDVLPNDGSKKLQKSSILYYLREDTMMTTKELRDNMQRFKFLYYLLKENELK